MVTYTSNGAQSPIPWYVGTKRRPFVSVYPGRFGDYAASWSESQRSARERNIEYKLGIRPAYRVNVRFKG